MSALDPPDPGTLYDERYQEIASLESRLTAALASTRTAVEALEKMTAERDAWKKTAQDKAGAASSTVENLRAARDRETERANRAERERDEWKRVAHESAAERGSLEHDRNQWKKIAEEWGARLREVEAMAGAMREALTKVDAEIVIVQKSDRTALLTAQHRRAIDDARMFVRGALSSDAGKDFAARLKAAEDRATRLYEAACNHEISEKRKDDAVNGELARLRAQLAAAESRARGLEEQLEAADDIVDKARWILDDSYKTDDDQARVLDAGLCVQLGELIDGYDRTVVPVLAASTDGQKERGNG